MTARGAGDARVSELNSQGEKQIDHRDTEEEGERGTSQWKADS